MQQDKSSNADMIHYISDQNLATVTFDDVEPASSSNEKMSKVKNISSLPQSFRNKRTDEIDESKSQVLINLQDFF